PQERVNYDPGLATTCRNTPCGSSGVREANNCPASGLDQVAGGGLAGRPPSARQGEMRKAGPWRWPECYLFLRIPLPKGLKRGRSRLSVSGGLQNDLGALPTVPVFRRVRGSLGHGDGVRPDDDREGPLSRQTPETVSSPSLASGVP